MRVWSKKEDGVPQTARYVGRPTKWGNPFSHKAGTKAEWMVGSRDEAVAAYEVWLLAQPELVEQVKRELQGKDLVCWCAPKRCHADVLLRIANEKGCKMTKSQIVTEIARQAAYNTPREGMTREAFVNASSYALSVAWGKDFEQMRAYMLEQVDAAMGPKQA